MRAAAERSGYGFVQLGKLACLPLLGAVRYTPELPRETPECVAFNQKTLETLRSDPRIRVVVLSGFWANPFRLDAPGGEETWITPDEAHEREIPTRDAERVLFEQAMTQTVRTLQAAGKQAIVLGDTPAFTFDPIWKISTSALPAERKLVEWLQVPNGGDTGYAAPGYLESAAYADAAMRETLGAISGATLVELKPTLCLSADHCLYRQGDSLFYADDRHLTPDGARYALRDFKIAGSLAKQ
jgi:hypothetical protein